MIYLLAAPLVSRSVKVVGTLVGGLVCLLLMGLPMLAILEQPLSPYWLSGQPTTVAGGAAPVVALPIGISAVPVPTLAPLPMNSVAEGVIAFAMTWLGVRYQWGGCGRSGIDCSCAVRTWWGAFGVQMPRVTTDQIRWAIPVSREQAQPGDLVFFDRTCTDCGADPTHVTLYLGGGQMIGAGDPVQINPVFTGFYASRNPRFGRVH